MEDLQDVHCHWGPSRTQSRYSFQKGRDIDITSLKVVILMGREHKKQELGGHVRLDVSTLAFSGHITYIRRKFSIFDR